MRWSFHRCGGNRWLSSLTHIADDGVILARGHRLAWPLAVIQKRAAPLGVGNRGRVHARLWGTLLGRLNLQLPPDPLYIHLWRMVFAFFINRRSTPELGLAQVGKFYLRSSPSFVLIESWVKPDHCQPGVHREILWNGCCKSFQWICLMWFCRPLDLWRYIVPFRQLSKSKLHP